MTVSNPLSQGKQGRLRQSLEARYERTSRITSGRPDISVRILERHQLPSGLESVPGWTDGKNISLNNAVLNVSGLSHDGLVAALGVNYHELAHTMYTPDLHSQLAADVRATGAWDSFNILEDQRAETFFSNTFSDAKKFFNALAIKFLMSTERQWESNFILVYGRRFLPAELVDQFRARFVKPELLTDFEAVIDAYRVLPLEHSPDPYRGAGRDAFDLITEFERLRRLLADVTGDGLTPSSGHNQNEAAISKRKTTSWDRNASKRRAEEVADRVRNEEEERPSLEDFIEPEDEDDEEEDASAEAGADDADESDEDGESNEAGDGDEGEPDDEGAEAEASTDGDGDDGEDGAEAAAEDSEAGDGEAEDGDPVEAEGGSGGEGDEDGSGADSEAESGEPSDGAGGDGAGGESDAPYGDEQLDDDGLRELLEEALDIISGGDDVASEVEDTRRAVRKAATGVYKPEMERAAPRSKAPVTLDRLTVITRITKELSDARVGAETVLKRNTRAGRLDPLEWSKARAHPGNFDFFDDWDAGLVGEEGEMEVAILCDTSGSMAYNMDAASFAMYAIKRSFEAVGESHVTCWGFSSGGALFFDRTEKLPKSVYPVYAAHGGTSPRATLEDALKVLSTSKAGMRVMVIITDGQWSGVQDADALIAAAGEAGIVTVLVGLDEAVENYGAHSCHIARDLKSVSELPEFATDIAVELVKRAESDARQG